MSSTEQQYWMVALALDATWKEVVYTYQGRNTLQPGQVVLAPFGKQVKLGFVVEETTKPRMTTKEITSLHDGVILPRESLLLQRWLSSYYPSTPGLHIQHMLPNYIRQTPPVEVPNVAAEENASLPPLTTLQEKTVRKMDLSSKSIVLHGITGSGKTRIYIERIEETLRSNKSAVLLYPEISLTSQLVKNLKEKFGDDQVIIFHSKQTPREQRTSWYKVLHSNKPYIAIGPRSCLFAPHSSLGILIVDEAHDSAYKQDSGSRYNALHVAAALASIHQASYIVGSATPPVAETKQILDKGGELICMHELAMGETNRQFTIVDMTDKKNTAGSSYLLSKQLREAITQSLEQQQQSLLFLNRRGTARNLLCNNCGWHAQCEKCDMPVTYHHDDYTLRCHVCGFSQPAIHNCPDCGETISLKSLGTKAVVEELKALFPHANIARFDSDNKKKDSFLAHYDNVSSGKIDILLGTQLITKGLDLPKLTVVGILQADSALLLPDYTSTERGFQQLTQVSGRVGRGHSQGRVIMQTYQPHNPLLSLVTSQDWHSLYDNELANRKPQLFPPYSYVMKVWVQKKTDKAAQAASIKLAKSLANRDIRIIGPAPSFYPKVGGAYHWQLLCFSSSRNKLAAIAKNLPKDVFHDLDPISLL